MMRAPDAIWIDTDGYWSGFDPSEIRTVIGEYTRTDLSQASVAAALEAAAMAAKLAGPDQALRDYELSAVGKDRRVMSMRCEAAIRALITTAQHDALAAHVAAEVAKARAEDAAKIEALETAAKAGAELAAYASYSEIVGAIGHNRPQIREWCDKVFAANHVLRDIEWKALTSTHEATQIGAKP